MKQLFLLFLLLWAVCPLAQGQSASSGRVRRLADFPSRLVSARHVDVWLPSGYSPSRKYSVLYMHDGQMLYDSTGTWNHKEWQVDETMGRLIKAGRIDDCIVVGIWNRGDYRHAEYFPQRPIGYLSPATQSKLMPELKGQSQADNYLKFIVTELKPHIDKTFPTYPDQAHTFIAGSSMGGLISLYALCEYPTVFGGAACLSTHWIGSRLMNDPSIPKAFAAYLTQKTPAPYTHKLYFDHGTAGLDSLYGPYQAAIDKVLRTRGYSTANLVSRVFEGEAHTEDAWARRFSLPVLFLLRKETAE